VRVGLPPFAAAIMEEDFCRIKTEASRLTGIFVQEPDFLCRIWLLCKAADPQDAIAKRKT
jgi:hypothetical protein